MDVVRLLGGLKVGVDEVAQFGLTVRREDMDSELSLEDVDFVARFDGSRWIVRWKWCGEVPKLHNRLAEYRMKDELRPGFEEVCAWIKEGILVPVPEGALVESVVPLMAVEQTNKGKFRPVLDYKALNTFISSHTGGSVVCEDTIRGWRKIGGNLSVLDLRKAYLQLHVDRSLWKHQVVKFQGKHFS